MKSLRHKLEEIRLASGRPAVAPAPGYATPRSVAEVLGGQVLASGDVPCWQIETPVAALSPAAATVAARVYPRLDIAGARAGAPGRALFFDLETGGLPGAPVFLVGVAVLDQRGPRLVQWLARDYPEEAAILAAFAQTAGDCPLWVSFNGKSFDEPVLRDRAQVHRVVMPPCLRHYDLLHAARRAWRGRVSNCRLVTLEAEILGVPRVGDVPSAEIPALFHHFIRTGNAAPLRGVLEHNRRDLITLIELIDRLPLDPCPAAPRRGRNGDRAPGPRPTR